MQEDFSDLNIPVDLVFRLLREVGFSRKKTQKIAFARDSKAVLYKRRELVLKLMHQGKQFLLMNPPFIFTKLLYMV